MINNDFLYKDFYEMLKKMIKKVCYHYIKKNKRHFTRH